ncbi:hypothetical protein [Amycolatopsis anabasis]|uniref:hypothetical protein n=1 Tax=Amycolatopsis anabasis TaxID=1840409 RepID=UPI00131AD885|nr:hypothetical protein [Amycolatopsis anabasis]
MLVATMVRSVGGFLLSIYKSVVVKTDGRLYRPVRDIIGNSCTTEVFAEIIEAPHMMFGEALLSVVKVWDVCPEDIAHICVNPHRSERRQGDGHPEESAA